AVRERPGQRVRGRPQGRPAGTAGAHAAPAAGRRPAGHRGQPRVLARPVRDQPGALGAPRGGRRVVPAEVRGPGDRPAPRPAGHVHGQAVQRRGRVRLPRARVGERRARPQHLRRPGRARRPVGHRPARDRRRARPRPGAERAAEPDDQLLQTGRPRHARAWLTDWGLASRTAMVGIPPERGPGARMEVRLGDATANPYLAMAAVGAAVYLGLRDKTEPPAKLEGYGYDPALAALLPQRLGDA